MFSPWNAWAGRRDPDNHVSLNVVTTGPGGRFTMTDRGRDALRATPDRLTLGPSSLHWDGTALTVTVDEVAGLPRPGRVRGTIRLEPEAVTGVELALTTDGAHVWRPFAPRARVTVDLPGNGGRWSGHGYLDGNFGTRPLEDDFRFWTWGRFPTKDGALCIYDAERRDGSRLDCAVRFDRAGQAWLDDAPGPVGFGLSGWRIRREVRADPGHVPTTALRMLDAPFYARTAVSTRIGGEEMTGVHEALDLDRFRSPVVKAMLAFRVPRRAGWRMPVA